MASLVAIVMSTDTEQLIETLAQRLAKWGVTAPALAFLEINRPLTFVLSQLIVFCQPLLDIFMAREQSTAWGALLADRDQIDALIARLEKHPRNQGSSPRPG